MNVRPELEGLVEEIKKRREKREASRLKVTSEEEES